MRLSPLHISASALAAVIGLALTSAPAQAGGKPSPVCDKRKQTTPEGMAVVIPLNGRRSFSDIQQAMANPYMRGVMVQVRWSDLEQTKGAPDWTMLDQIFAQAEKNRQWVHLGIFAGFWSPAWALKGVKTDQFVVPYGPEHGQTLPLPMPWDETYLTRWFNFVRMVAERYGSSSAFRMIGAAGPTSVSDEMTLPEQVGKWQADGFTPLKYLNAWSETFIEYERDFPNQCISISGPGVPILPGATLAERTRYRAQVVDSAQNVFLGRLAVQENDLHAGHVKIEAPDLTDFIIGYINEDITGFMMRGGSEGPGPSEAMGAANNPPLALQRSIDKGLAPNSLGRHVDYLEIYIVDVISPDMQDVLKKTAKRFERGPDH